MSALLGTFWPYLAAAGVALIGFWRVYAAGAKANEAKHTAGKLVAAKDRLEMDREATAAELKAAGMSDAEARKEALRWTPKR